MGRCKETGKNSLMKGLGGEQKKHQDTQRGEELFEQAILKAKNNDI